MLLKFEVGFVLVEIACIWQRLKLCIFILLISEKFTKRAFQGFGFITFKQQILTFSLHLEIGNVALGDY